MALLLLKKLLKTPPSSSSPSPLRFLTSWSGPHLPNSPPSPSLSPMLYLIPPYVTGENQRPPVPDSGGESFCCSLLYNSVGISYPCLPCLLDTGGNHEDGAMWADSVKRKRKGKMNKHKYKKRRKLLRKKT